MMAVVVLVVLFVYALFIFFLIKHINKTTDVTFSVNTAPISIVIPMRNESNTILDCLNSIEKQEGSDIQFEVLLIDDHSNDGSFEKASNWKGSLDLRILKSKGSGKKNALLFGIEHAKYKHILTLDSDCVVSSTWLNSMANEYFSKQLNMLCGPIALRSNSLFQDFQQSESAAIVGISMVSLNQKMPSTCNGANLMFDKSVFNEVGAYSGNEDVASGDDDLLMHKFCKKDMHKVAYSQNPSAMVYARAVVGFKEFIQQRARWLSKRKLYQYNYNQWIHALIGVKLLVFYFCLIQSLLGNGLEYSMMAMGFVFFDLLYAKALLKMYTINVFTVVLSSFYLLYVFPSYVLTLVGKIEWKGRKIN